LTLQASKDQGNEVILCPVGDIATIAPLYSFEFFPPKTPEGEKSLLKTAQRLSALNPHFMTVTFGAGGSTRDKTLSTLESLQTVTKAELACHLTFISLTKTELTAYLTRLSKMGVNRVVALRGDMPKDLQWPLDPDQDYYQYTSDFIAGIKSHGGFDISVGAYPDKHPDAPDMEADIIALKKKCEAGADRAITQFFFDHDNYSRFLERVAHASISCPVVPGLLPISNYDSMLSFAGRCGAQVPLFIRERFERAKPEDHNKIALDILMAQIDDLRMRGAPHLHFYTLNKADLLCEALK